jgi:putative ABC transport system substrate-binding protein
MNRRAFITLAGGAAAWPLAARAQQAERVRRIGVLSGLTPDDPQSQAELAALRDGLARSGWIVGRNLQSENRFAAGDERRIRAFAEELVGNIPDVILARGTLATEILKQQTSTIPIVFVPVSDPVASGFVASFARPGSNITGFTDEEYSFGAKWLSILKNISPNLRHVMVLYDPGNANWDGYFRTLQAAEQSMMVSVSPAPVISSGDISSQMESFALQPGGGVIVVARQSEWRWRLKGAERVNKAPAPRVDTLRAGACGFRPGRWMALPRPRSMLRALAPINCDLLQLAKA